MVYWYVFGPVWLVHGLYWPIKRVAVALTAKFHPNTNFMPDLTLTLPITFIDMTENIGLFFRTHSGSLDQLPVFCLFYVTAYVNPQAVMSVCPSHFAHCSYTLDCV